MHTTIAYALIDVVLYLAFSVIRTLKDMQGEHVMHHQLHLHYDSSRLECSNEVVRGGSAWGAGTFANGDGSRQPTELELEFAKFQVRHYAAQITLASPSCLLLLLASLNHDMYLAWTRIEFAGKCFDD